VEGDKLSRFERAPMKAEMAKAQRRRCREFLALRTGGQRLDKLEELFRTLRQKNRQRREASTTWHSPEESRRAQRPLGTSLDPRQFTPWDAESPQTHHVLFLRRTCTVAWWCEGYDVAALVYCLIGVCRSPQKFWGVDPDDQP